LQKIVTELAADHEVDVGEAMATREEARAEARALQLKIAQHEREREALKQRIEIEWGAKLQKIVAELTTDHENDMGDAIAAREAARAEFRNLNIKMTSLQQKLEAERQARESLQTRLREAETQIHAAPTQPMAALQLPVEPPQEEERARADVLQFAEQAY